MYNYSKVTYVYFGKEIHVKNFDHIYVHVYV